MRAREFWLEFIAGAALAALVITIGYSAALFLPKLLLP